MKALALPKTCFLRKSWEYSQVYRIGKRLRGNHFSVIFTPNGKAESRIGISIHGVKKAVRRNRIKRIIREFFRLNRSVFPLPVDVIFAVRKEFVLDSPGEMEAVVVSLLKGKP